MINSAKTLDWFASGPSRPRGQRRCEIVFVILLALQIILAPAGFAAKATQAKPNSSDVTLVMVEETGCPYCVRWHREIGSIYAKTPEGRFAPLKTVFIHENQAQAFKRVVYTPTFIVMRKGKEVGRILGYTGQNFFWPMLEELLKKAGYSPEQSSAVTQ